MNKLKKVHESWRAVSHATVELDSQCPRLRFWPSKLLFHPGICNFIWSILLLSNPDGQDLHQLLGGTSWATTAGNVLRQQKSLSEGSTEGESSRDCENGFQIAARYKKITARTELLILRTTLAVKMKKDPEIFLRLCAKVSAFTRKLTHMAQSLFAERQQDSER